MTQEWGNSDKDLFDIYFADTEVVGTGVNHNMELIPMKRRH